MWARTVAGRRPEPAKLANNQATWSFTVAEAGQREPSTIKNSNRPRTVYSSGLHHADRPPKIFTWDGKGQQRPSNGRDGKLHPVGDRPRTPSGPGPVLESPPRCRAWSISVDLHRKTPAMLRIGGPELHPRQDQARSCGRGGGRSPPARSASPRQSIRKGFASQRSRLLGDHSAVTAELQHCA